MKTHVIHQRFSVSFAYPVYFTRTLFATKNRTLLNVLCTRNNLLPSKILLVVDQGVVSATPGLLDQIKTFFTFHSDKFLLLGAPLLICGGEHAKNGWGHVREIMTRAGNGHLDRHSFIIAIGGGSILDMAGFAAALIHRGVRFVRIPTTVLAQNDAGIGVKNGMNDGGAKNFIGTFTPPYAVINDFQFLKTLSDTDWIGGISEAFKVAIIADKPFFNELCANVAALKKRKMRAMEELVRRTAALHLKHIATSGDPFEFGSARPLDFGHWAAHRLELVSDFTLSHGHAVSIGIALDSTYAMLKGMISEADHAAILSALSGVGLPIFSPLLQRTEHGTYDVLKGLEQFREHLGGKLTITLPCPLGSKREVHTMSESLLIKAIDLLSDHACHTH